jgi:hypothetical protein
MRRSVGFLIAVILVAVVGSRVASAQSQTQSLGDYARAVKKAKAQSASEAKPSSKVYDNDNLPQTTPISVVGNSTPSTASDGSNASDDKNPDGTPKQDAQSSDKKKEPELKPGQPSDERQKALDAWKDKLAGEQEKISKLSHELEIAQREYQIKIAEFYANTAERAQNPSAFHDEDEKFKQEIADKQKLLDDEKAKLNEMQDDARKAGAPSSVIEGEPASEKSSDKD